LSIFSLFYDLESWWGNGLAFTERAAAWGVEACSFLERKTTLFAMCRFHSKSLGICRLGDMLEMIKHFSFFDAEELRNFTQIEALSP
jgi:hypothetical protein